MRTPPLLTLLLFLLITLLPSIHADATAEAVSPDIPVSPADIEGASKLTAPLPEGFSFSKDEEAKIHESGEKYQFETEVNKLMKIIINSLYKTKGWMVWPLRGWRHLRLRN